MGPRTATARSRAKPRALLVALALAPGCVPAADTLSPCGGAGVGASGTYGGAASGTGNRLDLGIDAGVGASDNIFEVAGPKTSEIIPTAGLLLASHRCTGSLTGDVAGDFAYYDYLHNSYPSDLYGRLDANLKLALVPDRVSWALQDDFGQAEFDLFEPPTPLNRENVNYVATGPDFSLHFGQEFVLLGLRYAAIQFQKSPFNSTRPYGTLSLGRELSANSALSLNFYAEHVVFQDTALNADYDRREAYLRYDLRGARTTLGLNVGATQTSQNGSWYSSPLVQLDLARRLTPRTTLTLSGGERQLDAADGFAGVQVGAVGGIVTAPAANTSAVYVSRYGSIAWNWVGNRTSIGVSERWESDSYLQDSIFNAKLNDLELSARRQLSRLLDARIFGSMYTYDYYGEHFKSYYHLAGAALVLHAAPKVDVTFSYDHLWETTSYTGTSGFAGFTENRLFLTATYWPVKTGGESGVPGGPGAGQLFPGQTTLP
jgi:hypothetical protein